jgi:transcriptional regulator with XRE-family HTH domain
MLKEFSSDLKAIREKSNISLAEISAQTRINENFLGKLESGDFSFQQEIYIKAFIKEYANAIGLDPAETIKDYDSAKRGDYKTKSDIKSDISEGPEIVEEDEVQKEKINKLVEEPDVTEENIDNILENKKKTQSQEKDEPEIDSAKNTDDEIQSSEDETNDESTEKIPPQVKSEKKIIPLKKRASEVVNKPPVVEQKKPSRKENLNLPEAVEKDGPFSFRQSGGDSISPTVVRTIGIIFLGLLLLVGLYFMGKALFFESDGDSPEIVRQKFDDVVQENERKLLGKRTEQEIQDSIRKAEEEAQRLIEQNLDTMTLVINSIRSGSVIVVEDSTDINNPEKISFTANQYGTWKATRFFQITSPNTSAFTVELNGKKIDIKDKSVKNYMITRKDLEGTDSTNTSNQ